MIVVDIADADDDARDVGVPEHREVRVDELVLGRQVQPDLEQLEWIPAVAVEQREHLRVLNAATRGEPLHVAAPEARAAAPSESAWSMTPRRT